MRKFKDSIGYRTRDLPAFSAVPQPTAVPHTPGVVYSLCILTDLPAPKHVAKNDLN